MSTSPLKILVVLPMYGGSLPVGRFCASALAELGHNVEVFEAPDFHPSYQALDRLRVTSDRQQYLENSFLQVVSNAVLAKVETFEPHLVLSMAQAPLTHQALKRLRRDGVATAMWFVEDYRLFTYWQSFAPFYDFFAVIQKDPFFAELEKVGQKNVLYLPLAAHPPFHTPMELSSAEKAKYGADISFMGAGYPNRRLAFRRLARPGFKIWGSDWDGDHVLESYVQLGGRRVTSEECVKIFNATKINLNLHSSVHVDKLVSNGDFVNPRTFELAACGAFQLVDQRSLLSEAFSDDELVRFSSIEELEDKINHYLTNDDERRAIAGRARARALAEHTYAARMISLLSFVEQGLGGWKRAGQGDDLFGPDFPDELRAEMLTLLNRLSLPENVSFEDLVWAIRRQQGTLSGLDTAILFLDEWRKQYRNKQ